MSELQQLSALSFQFRPTPSADIGDKGELAWLPLKHLRVDPNYQRAILDTGKANIRRMIEGFSWLLFGTVVVSRRAKDVYAVIDGQHRATAAMLHGKIVDVPCLILKGGPEAEARAFSAINGNVTRIHSLQSFRASVAAKDAASLELVRICANADVTIAPYPKAELLPGETMALGYVRVCLRRYGEPDLSAALKILRHADRDAGLSAAAIMGTCAAVHERPEWRRKPDSLGRMVAERVHGLAALGEKARSRKATRGGVEWVNFQAVITSTLVAAQQTGGAPLNRLMAGR